MWALIIHPHSKSNWSPESWRLGGSEQHAPLYACINWYSTNVFYNACIRRYSVLLMVGAWHIYCCSVHPGREIPPPWLFLRFLWLSSLESKDRRCCTLYTFKQCNPWLWAMWMKLKWYIHTRTYSVQCKYDPKSWTSSVLQCKFNKMCVSPVELRKG